MATVLLLLAVTGAMNTALVLSMGRRWKTVLVGCALAAGGLYASHFWLIHISFVGLAKPETTAAWHPLLSLALSIEAALVIASSTRTSHTQAAWPGTRLGRRLSRGLQQLLAATAGLPPVAGIAAALALQAWLFHEVSHWSLSALSLLGSVGVVLAALLGALTLRAVMPQPHDRVELRVWLAALQAVLAIALPVIGLAAPSPPPFTPDPGPTAGVLAALTALVALGFVTHTMGHRRTPARTES